MTKAPRDTTTITLAEAGRRAAKAARAAKAPPPRTDDDTRPTVTIRAGDLPRMVTETERAIIKADIGVYQRAGALVTTGTVPVMTSEHREIEAQQIVPLGDHALLEAASAAAYFEKWDARVGDMVSANASMMIVKALEQRIGKFKFPVLSGIIGAPTLRADGSILSTPGYDKRSGLLLDPAGVTFPAIPERPSRAAAETALGILGDIIAGFPFVTPADRSVALALLLTAVVRRSLRTAPLFGLTAPTPGSGKSLIVDCGSVLSTGKEAGVVAMSGNPEELEKRLGALLMGGAHIALDNIEQPLGGDLLCQLLTQQTVRPRILGKSEVPEVPTSVLVTATGNNLTLFGDMTRRALLCRLDAGVERPELREFDFDPVERAKAERGKLVVAALTILRAYHVAGRPAQAAPLGSFEDWSRTVRDALLWLGCADPVSTMDVARALDPKMERLRSVMVNWNAVIGGERVSVSQVIDRASEKAGFTQHDPANKAPFINPDFRDALLSVAGAGGFIDPTKLGNWLAKHKNRPTITGFFELDGEAMGKGYWRLNATKGSSGMGSIGHVLAGWDGLEPRF